MLEKWRGREERTVGLVIALPARTVGTCGRSANKGDGPGRFKAERVELGFRTWQARKQEKGSDRENGSGLLKAP